MTAAAAAPAVLALPGRAVPPDPVRVTPGDPRYAGLVRRGNRRFTGSPDEVWVADTPGEVLAAVQAAVTAGRRPAVRSGGHGFEDFVDNPDVRSLIDISGLTGVTYDERLGAYAVLAGTTLGETYRRLYLDWGVTLPGGSCPGVGTGGHVAGGGYGPLSRMHGLMADHLYAVEVVVVADGRARTVVATREPADPHRDLWWAHTGGGGGSFGAVTRYWFRDPPRPPASVTNFDATWSWDGLDLVRLARNFTDWCRRYDRPGLPQSRLYAELLLTNRAAGAVTVHGRVAGAGLIDDFLGSLTAGVGVTPQVTRETLPWLQATLRDPGDDGKRWRLKTKAAYVRRPLSDEQWAVACRSLSDPGYPNPAASMSLNTYGGAVNAVAPSATAVARRDAAVLMFFLTAWSDPAEDARHLGWIRSLYHGMYAASGGIPVDGSYINYPDADLADPRWNTSGRGWAEIYYGGNYARLQRVKRRYDPEDVFRHRLSVRPVSAPVS